MVINRAGFLAGEYERVFDEIAATREACGTAHLKVILETGELQTYDTFAWPAKSRCVPERIFIRLQPGKITGRDPAVTLVMLEAIAIIFTRPHSDWDEAAGGIRTAKEALTYLVMVKETLATIGSVPIFSALAPAPCLTTFSCNW